METLSLPMSNGEHKIFVVKFHTNLFWQLLMETLPLPLSNGELKIFNEYHSIQMLNRSFQQCVKFHTNLFCQLLMKTISLSVSMN